MLWHTRCSVVDPDDPCSNPTSEYSGWPALDDWPALASDVQLWNHHFDRLQQARIAAGSRLAGVVEIAIRAAAADSGAIEGLYSITAGATRQVAGVTSFPGVVFCADQRAYLTQHMPSDSRPPRSPARQR